jgi:transglutaminase-like putative cysteine protease
MAIRVALSHHTRYRYDRRVTVHPQVIRLRPAPHSRTPVSSYSLKVSPSEHFLNWQQDPFGNFMARLVFPEAVDHLDVYVDMVAELEPINPFDFFVEDYAFHTPFAYPPFLRKELTPYLEPVTGGDRISRPWWPGHVSGITANGGTPEPRQSTVDFLVEVNRELHERIAYTIREEPGVRTPEETLTLASGSCRDSGWLLVSLLRQLGIAARFVSGYLIQLTWDEPDRRRLSRGRRRFHRSARLDRGLRARGRLDRPGPHLGAVLPARVTFPWPPRPRLQSAAPIAGSPAACEVTSTST